MSRPRWMRPPRVEMTEPQRLATKACHAVDLPGPYDLGQGASFWSAVPGHDGGVWTSADGRYLLSPTPAGWLVTLDGEVLT